MRDKIKTYLRAGYACLYASSYEEERVANDIMVIAKDMKYAVWNWTATAGLISPDGGLVEKTKDPTLAMLAFCAMENTNGTEGRFVKTKSIVLLRDFHLHLKKSDPVLIRAIKEAIISGRATNRHLIIVGCQLHLPPELEKEVTVIGFSLPSREELKAMADGTIDAAANSGKKIKIKDMDLLLDAGSGLTTMEFADALAFSIIDKDAVDPALIGRIKSDTIKKNGILELIDRTVSMDDIGGLDMLKADLYSKRKAFTKAARDYGLPTPRALLCVGNPGTGKSLTAQAAGGIFGVPLLRLEAGRLFGGLVGESESNWRTTFATAKAIAPVVFWIDEVDGLFAGSESGASDGGTTSRVIKAIIQDMQFNAEGIFFVFTANDIDSLPDPLVDRCEIWNVELPNYVEREAIWKIHIAKRQRNPDDFLTKTFAFQTSGFSGRQIEQAWLAAMTAAFNDGAREPRNEDVLDVLKLFVPTSKTMADKIARRRERLKDCARQASSPEPELAVVDGSLVGATFQSKNGSSPHEQYRCWS